MENLYSMFQIAFCHFVCSFDGIRVVKLNNLIENSSLVRNNSFAQNSPWGRLTFCLIYSEEFPRFLKLNHFSKHSNLMFEKLEIGGWGRELIRV